ncbi:hypothetical protein CANCADRAFT_139735 [Tortispora caseinolytica NRRL Y-17796]|uniref:histone acetyltransferase n=1 Tax=Tortispora caseinolytica NRRL Y-17796 TaxID=767744 RepID=A0A1E4TCH6_9ASCO|nr:hypothetical protein CANCADRAFT_139735 [Tortispora caseinolytica NRRL Y-17796]
MEQNLANCLPENYRFFLSESRTKEVPRKLTLAKDAAKGTGSTRLYLLEHKDLAVFGLEVEIYNEPDLVTIFISKADTTGYYYMQEPKPPTLSIRRIAQVILAEIIKEFPDRKVRLCIFTRPEKQYLFGLSSKCPHKHILSGLQLLKWWISVAENVVQNVCEHSSLHKYALSPGMDDADMKRLLDHVPGWQIGTVFCPKEEQDTVKAVDVIPQFSDDPKTRFVNAIETDHRKDEVTVKMFLEEIQGRQEFRLAQTVGIIGVVGVTKPTAKTAKWDHELIDTHSYDRLHEQLLNGDYSNITSAKNATADIVKSMTYRTDIIGSLKQLVSEKAKEPAKRVNTLSAGLVRKKPKTTS